MAPIAPTHPANRWRRHDGSPGLHDADFLVAPDPRIGPVISAETNRRRSGWIAGDRTLREQRIGFGVLGCFVGLICMIASHADRLESWLTGSSGIDTTHKLAALGAALVGAALGALLPLLWRSQRSSYVGQFGVQTYLKRPLGAPRLDVVSFAQCAKRRVQRTRNFLNGAYTLTRYHYAWFDDRDARLFVIEGGYDDRTPVRSPEPVAFAHAAELAWQRYRDNQGRRAIGM